MIRDLGACPDHYLHVSLAMLSVLARADQWQATSAGDVIDDLLEGQIKCQATSADEVMDDFLGWHITMTAVKPDGIQGISHDRSD